MTQVISVAVAYVWAHPLTIVGAVLCAVLYARIMMAGPRQG
jgi:hypothetical protein